MILTRTPPPSMPELLADLTTENQTQRRRIERLEEAVSEYREALESLYVAVQMFSNMDSHDVAMQKARSILSDQVAAAEPRITGDLLARAYFSEDA